MPSGFQGQPSGGGGGGFKKPLCKYFNTPQGCKKGDSCNMYHPKGGKVGQEGPGSHGFGGGPPGMFGGYSQNTSGGANY